MNIDSFKRMVEKPIYSTLSELFDKAELSEIERDAYLRNRKYCEYLLLRSKMEYHQSFNRAIPNFIKRLARVINHLESDAVTGNKKQKIKEMFGFNSPVHRVFKSKTGYRSTKNSPILENTYFELLILSFFVERGFDIDLIKSRGIGKRIPEFVASRNRVKFSVEAKQIELDRLLNNIFGDVFTDGNYPQRTEEELEKGYEKIRAQIESRYDDAIIKYKHIANDEKYIIFMSIYYNLSSIGKPAIDFLNSLHSKWAELDMKNFVGIVIPEETQTHFIINEGCDQKTLDVVGQLEIENFHKFEP